MRRAVLKAAKRWLILGHRWLGIATGLLFALWIGSGLVMLYVPFPRLAEAERIARLAPIAWERVSISPDGALASARLERPPARFELEMRGDDPVYRISAADGARVTVSARTGERLAPIGPDEAGRLAGKAGAAVETVTRDQWTVTARYDPLRPFHKVVLGDDAGTETYVSAATGEVALVTTRWQRGWNWAGSIVHWVYPTPLRARADLWRDVVLWLSGIAALNALSGLALGIWRLRLSRRYPSGSMTPYRGLARWHHVFGLTGGVALTTFIVSDWLSMNPNRWFSSPTPPAELLAAYAGDRGPIGLDPAALQRIAAPGAVSLRFVAIGGRPFVVSRSRTAMTGVGADGLAAPGMDAIVAAATGAMAGASLDAVEQLPSADAYWSPGGDARPLPVLRLRFADPAATWLHIDPRDGTILNRLDRSGRANRWLFDALHRLDLPVLTTHRPARDAAQWVLNLLGAVVVATGLVAGWRRLRRASPVYTCRKVESGTIRFKREKPFYASHLTESVLRKCRVSVIRYCVETESFSHT